MYSGESLTVRPLERKDIPTLANLIRELSIYEKMEDQVVMTEKDWERDAFDINPPHFRCLVADLPLHSDKPTDSSFSKTNEEMTIVGYGIYFYTYSTWDGKGIHLEDFYVSPNFRKYGVGTKILKELAKIAVAEDFARITCECLDWNEIAKNFYRKHNGIDSTEKDDWHIFRFMKENLPKMANC